MGDVINLKTKKVVMTTDRLMWERMYFTKSEEADKWYKKHLDMNQKVYRMSLWDRIFNWPY